MNWIIENWYIVIGLVALGAVAAYFFMEFLQQPKTEQLVKVKEWLLYAVTQAEAELGQGTGELKLRYVYDLFVGKFAALSLVVSFDQFASFVDEALDKMETMLSNNEAIQDLVSGQEEEESTAEVDESETEEDVEAETQAEAN